MLLHSYFQVSPEMIDWVQVRALAGPLKDIQRLVPKPRLRSLGCVLRVVVLLECEPLPQSEVLSALEQVFINLLRVGGSIFVFGKKTYPFETAYFSAPETRICI